MCDIPPNSVDSSVVSVQALEVEFTQLEGKEAPIWGATDCVESVVAAQCREMADILILQTQHYLDLMHIKEREATPPPAANDVDRTQSRPAAPQP